jgi:hypothetical protein
MTTLHPLKEAFLHYLWRLKRFDLHDLKTTTGEEVQIRDFGEYHQDQGPDFMNARIAIGTTLWAGNVEMHVLASDWRRHRHQEDPAYRNVILHVVYEEDEPVFHPGGERIPCLELKNRIPPLVHQRYQALLRNEAWIPCQHLIQEVPESIRAMWLTRLAVERLETKTATIADTLAQLQNDWEETFYRHIAYSFGVKVNCEAFFQLACATPLRILLKCRHQPLQTEALLFGQAGLLEGPFTDEYPIALVQEYRYLKNKYDLTPIQQSAWKFLRLRPASFPTVRIAQFAALLHHHGQLFEKIISLVDLKEMTSLFQVKPADYWLTHYTFDHPSPTKEKVLGADTIALLTINTIAPVLFLYGEYKGEETFKDQALNLLEKIKAEKNVITDKWQELGLSPAQAAHSQALIQLKSFYCDNKRCLECAIGNAIINK